MYELDICLDKNKLTETSKMHFGTAEVAEVPLETISLTVLSELAGLTVSCPVLMSLAHWKTTCREAHWGTMTSSPVSVDSRFSFLPHCAHFTLLAQQQRMNHGFGGGKEPVVQ